MVGGCSGGDGDVVEEEMEDVVEEEMGDVVEEEMEDVVEVAVQTGGDA